MNRTILKRLLVIGVSVIISTLALVAQNDVQEQRFNAVTTSVPSLHISPGARAAGMGDVGVSSTPDVNSQYYNPSKYALLSSKAGVSFTYTPWLAKLVNDIKLMELTGYYKIGSENNQALSASLRFFSLGTIRTFDDLARSLGEAHPNEFALDFGYSLQITSDYSMGVVLRYIRSDQNTASSTGENRAGNAFAADIAGYLTKYFVAGDSEPLWTFGFNISNIGTKISYGGKQSMFIPTNLRVGTGILYPFDDYNALSLNIEANKLLVPTPPIKDPTKPDEYARKIEEYQKTSSIAGIFKSFGDAPGGFKEELQEINLGIGAEYSYNNRFFLRAGYQYQHPNKGNLQYFTAGAGFKMSVFSLDASYLISAVPSNPLDQTLRFSLSFDMDGIRNLLR
ncbi:type IX secretion system outer membrane channel protein PorV [Porphyromonas endodontalis]|uniref:type IX secretion system outer membrane channel protein PorV n=1 Tax=Porphyromonas endodontalis TaxID=28124 RepID=UPI0028803E16|nr:type IX secretion system outer membrane channel protein PorV [Porphyromonas endodontalis]